MLSCSIWFSAPSLWMGGGLESRCVGRVYGVDGAVQHWLQLVKKPPHFMEPESSLPHSQASATCPYLGTAQSSPYTHIPPPGDPS